MAAGLLFTIGEARAFAGGKLADADTYPDAAINGGHDAIRADFEEILGVALAPTEVTTVLDGDPEALPGDRYRWPLVRELVLPHQEVGAVTAVYTREAGTDTWMPLSVEQLVAVRATADGRLVREGAGWPPGVQNVRVAYSHGLASVPLPLKRAALVVLVDQLVASDVTERSTAYTDQTGQTYRLATAGMGGSAWYGLPAVDSVLARFRRRIPGVA